MWLLGAGAAVVVVVVDGSGSGLRSNPVALEPRSTASTRRGRRHDDPKVWGRGGQGKTLEGWLCCPAATEERSCFVDLRETCWSAQQRQARVRAAPPKSTKPCVQKQKRDQPATDGQVCSSKKKAQADGANNSSSRRTDGQKTATLLALLLDRRTLELDQAAGSRQQAVEFFDRRRRVRRTWSLSGTVGSFEVGMALQKDLRYRMFLQYRHAFTLHVG